MRRLLAILKTLLFTVLVPGTVAFYVPRRMLSSGAAGDLNLGAVRFVGFPLLAAGIAGYLWCAWNFAAVGLGTPAPIDPPKHLVVRGPYRYVRNPMYVSVASVLFGEALFFRSSALLWYASAVFLFFHLFVVLYEEPALTGTFGESYQNYRNRVPRWIPWLRSHTRWVDASKRSGS